MTSREEFFKHLIDDYLFVDGVDRDGWRWYGARKYKQFGSSGNTECKWEISTGKFARVTLAQREYVIVETGEDPIGNCPERAYAYHSYEEMFDAWKTNFVEMFCEKLHDFSLLKRYEKFYQEDFETEE